MAKLKPKATILYDKIYQVFQKKWKILVLRWGTRSSKTYSMMQKIVLWLITGKIDWHTHYVTEEGKKQIKTVDIVRKNSTTLKATVMQDAQEIIDEWWLREHIYINNTEKIFKYWGRTLRFFWADDQQKVRGSKRDLLYCNEANELEYKKEFFQLLIRTRRRVVIDFNPDDEDIRINTELEQKRQYTKKDVEVLVSTYKDNPFLSREEVAEIEHIKEVDEYLWTVYWEWWYGKLQWAVFNNRDIIGELPEDAKLLCYWMDFGFTNDPTACIWIYRYNWEIVLDEELYERSLTNEDIDRELAHIREARLHTVADSAEPKSIEELKRLWWNIEPASKWPDSVMYWINTLKKYKIKITARSVNTIKEFKKYKRKEDRKTGELLNEPVDKFNHAIDAVRYWAIEYLWTEPTDYVDMAKAWIS